MFDLKELCRESMELVKRTGGFIGAQVGKVGSQAIEEKSLNSLVSYVDREAERQLVDGLGSLLPGATFLTEEGTVASEKSPQQWIIDPLDGTTNFLHGLPCFSVSVALQQDGRTVMGIVYEITRQECFYAWENSGAYLNGNRIRVSSTSRLADSLIGTGFPYDDYTWIGPYFLVLEQFMRRTRGIRRFGSAAVDLAFVACGRFDAFFEYSLNPWDVAAGAFLVQEAGGKVTDFLRGDNYLHGREIISGNPQVFPEVNAAIKKAFYPKGPPKPPH